MGKRITFFLIIPLLLTILVTSCFLFGTVKEVTILAYPDFLDPEELTLESEVRTLLKITPAINGRNLFITEPNGKIKFKDIPEGEYTVHVVFVDTIYDRHFFVPEDSDIQIAYPSAGIVCAAVNVNSDVAELQDANVRSALASAINRGNLISNTSTDGTSAIVLIPPTYYGRDGLDHQEGIYEGNPVDAILQNDDYFSFDFLCTDTTTPMGAEMESQWELVEKVTDVTVTTRDWETFKTEFEAKQFDIARWGWALDSNNLFGYLKKVAWVSGFTDETLEGYFDDAEAALEDDDLAAHTDSLETIASYLNNRMCTIPLYFINP